MFREVAKTIVDPPTKAILRHAGTFGCNKELVAKQTSRAQSAASAFVHGNYAFIGQFGEVSSAMSETIKQSQG